MTEIPDNLRACGECENCIAYAAKLAQLEELAAEAARVAQLLDGIESHLASFWDEVSAINIETIKEAQ